MKNVLACLICLFSILSLPAQNGAFKWGNANGSSGLDISNSVCEDARGNLYSTGFISGDCDMDPGSGTAVLACASGSHVFVRKMTADGQFVWAKSLVGNGGYDRGFVIRSDGDAGILVAGNIDGTADLDPGPGQVMYTAQGIEDLFLVKLDTNGNFLWAKTMHSFARIVPEDLRIDQNGDIFVTGYFNGTVDFDPGPGSHPLTSGSVADIFVCKLDGSGNFLWAKNLVADASNNSAGSLVLDDAGNPLITGLFYGNIDLDPGAGTAMHGSNGYTDIFVVKLTGNGDFVWGHAFGGTLLDFGSAAALDDQGNSYITGVFSEIVDFDPGAGIATCGTGGCRDVFLLKLDTNGNLVWAKSLSGSGALDSGNSLSVDAQGDVVVMGNFNETLDLDPGSGSQPVTAVDFRDIFVIKINPAGDLLWGRTFGGQGDDVGMEMISGKLGEIYICGYFYDDIDLDPGPNQVLVAAQGDGDLYTVALENIFVVGNELQLEGQVQVFPNPNNGVFRIDHASGEALHYRLFSTEGRLLQSGTGMPGSVLEVNAELAAGVYLLEIQVGDRMERRKLLVR